MRQCRYHGYGFRARLHTFHDGSARVLLPVRSMQHNNVGPLGVGDQTGCGENQRCRAKQSTGERCLHPVFSHGCLTACKKARVSVRAVSLYIQPVHLGGHMPNLTLIPALFRVRVCVCARRHRILRERCTHSPGVRAPGQFLQPSIQFFLQSYCTRS